MGDESEVVNKDELRTLRDSQATINNLQKEYKIIKQEKADFSKQEANHNPDTHQKY